MKMFTNLYFGVDVETSPGVYTRQLISHGMPVDISQRTHRVDPGDGIIDNLRLNYECSVVMDPFMAQHYSNLTSIEIMNVQWKVSSVRIDLPRIYFSTTEVYNGRSQSC